MIKLNFPMTNLLLLPPMDILGMTYSCGGDILILCLDGVIRCCHQVIPSRQ